MGFSVSGATAIVFAGLFVSFGMFYTTTANTAEQVSDANGQWQDRVLEQQNTAIDIVTASYNATTDTLVVEANNTGAAALSTNATDLLVDNAYQGNFDAVSVDGDPATTLWLPGETVRFELTTTTQPDRVKLVTETGVAGTEVVTSG